MIFSYINVFIRFGYVWILNLVYLFNKYVLKVCYRLVLKIIVLCNGNFIIMKIYIDKYKYIGKEDVNRKLFFLC